MKKILISLSMILLIIISVMSIGGVYSHTEHNIHINCSISYRAERFNYNNNGNITDYVGDNETYVYIPPTNNSGQAITGIDNMVFNNNSTIEILEISESVTSIGWLNFFNCPNLKAIILHAENPITSWTSIFGWQLEDDVIIYVPDSAYETYKKASGWNRYKNQIAKLSTYTA